MYLQDGAFDFIIKADELVQHSTLRHLSLTMRYVVSTSGSAWI